MRKYPSAKDVAKLTKRGRYAVTLAEARERGYQARLKLLDGIDPLTEKRTVKREKLLATSHAKTFKECAAAYIAAHESGWKGSASRKQWQQSLERYVHPKFGNLPVANVDLACVLSVLEPIWTMIHDS